VTCALELKMRKIGDYLRDEHRTFRKEVPSTNGLYKLLQTYYEAEEEELKKAA